MKPKVYITYNWHGRTEEKWLFWLKKKVEALGCEVLLTRTSKIPNPTDWLEELEKSLNISQTHIVTHDPGCLTLLSYITKLKEQHIQQKILLIAGQPDMRARQKAALLTAGKNLEKISGKSQEDNSQELIQQSNQHELLVASMTKLSVVVVYDPTSYSSDERGERMLELARLLIG